MPLFLTFITHNIHSYNTVFCPSSFAEARLLVASLLLRSAREASGLPFSQQSDALTTELRHTLFLIARSFFLKQGTQGITRHMHGCS